MIGGGGLRTVEIQIPGSGKEIRYSPEIADLADSLVKKLSESLDAGDIDEIEAAGRIALASLLSLYAAGDLPEKYAFTFLKALADKKTPNPVVKVEQTTQVDMKVLVADLVTANPDALQSIIDKASAARVEIARKLGGSLQLASVVDDDGGIPLHLGEPAEIAEIRGEKEDSDEWRRFGQLSE